MQKSAMHWMFEPLRKYAVFGGRARRAEYWWFSLLVVLISIVAAFFDTMVTAPLGAPEPSDANPFGNAGLGVVSVLVSLAFLLPGLGASVRRLHDVDKSGWWVLIAFIPLIGGLILLFWFCTRGTQGPNKYGDDPLQSPQFFT